MSAPRTATPLSLKMLLIAMALLQLITIPRGVFAAIDSGWALVNESGAAPSACYEMGMAYDLATSRTVLFGGRKLDASVVTDARTWTWDGAAWTGIDTAGPSARYGPAMAYDAARKRTVLFGGYDGSDQSDTWEWNGSAWEEKDIVGPSGRSMSGMSYDSTRHVMVLFGGIRGGAVLRDTWEYDGSTWTQAATTGPTARRLTSLSFHVATNRTVLFGGHDGSKAVGDTWEWNGESWTEVFPKMSPLARYGSGMCTDSLMGRLVLFGGLSGSTYLRDTWTWNGSNWIQIGAAGPSTRGGSGFVYDSSRHRTVLFGGKGTGSGAAEIVLADTWEMNVLGTDDVFPATPRGETWVANGPVFSVATNETTIYMTGNFTSIGPCTGGGAVLDPVSGAVPPGNSKVHGTVSTVLPDKFGGWYIGGSFLRVGQTPRKNLAHILPDGSLDLVWNPGADAAVNALASSPSGSTIYVGGEFGSIGGQTRQHIAELDAASGAVTGWTPNANGGVAAIAVSPLGSPVYVGGYFTVIGGSSRNYIGAIDSTTGQATAWDPDARFDNNISNKAEVRALVVSPTGSLVYVGGHFNSIGGDPAGGIVAIDAATGRSTGWDHTPPRGDSFYWVFSLALSPSGSTLYIGDTSGAWSIDLKSGGLDTGWEIELDGYVQSVRVSPTGSTVYLGGHFRYIGQELRIGIAELDATTGWPTGWNPVTDGGVLAIAPSSAGSMLYVGGDFSSMGGKNRYGLAAINAATGMATGWNPGVNGGTSVLALSTKHVYVGGSFSSIGGKPRARIAALDPNTGAASNWNPGADGVVESIAVSPSEDVIYAGGKFATIGGQTRSHLAALDARTGRATTWNPNVQGDVPDIYHNTTVKAIAVTSSGATVYVGGYFKTLGGQERTNLAALDGITAAASEWKPSVSGAVQTIALPPSDSPVYIGGHFSTVDGFPPYGLAAFDPGTGRARIWLLNTTGSFPGGQSIYTVAVSPTGSTIYFGGAFDTIGGNQRHCIASMDAKSGVVTGWNPIAYNLGGAGSVRSIALSNSGKTLYAGGDYHYLGDEILPDFAEFDFEEQTDILQLLARLLGVNDSTIPDLNTDGVIDAADLPIAAGL